MHKETMFPYAKASGLPSSAYCTNSVNPAASTSSAIKPPNTVAGIPDSAFSVFCLYAKIRNFCEKAKSNLRKTENIKYNLIYTL